jgi:hypothetical protein
MQKKLISLLPNWFKVIPQFDKILHLIAGLVIYFLSCLVLNNIYALLIVFTVALGKEYFDGTSTRQSFFDFLATFLSPLLICIIQNI